MPLFPQNRTTSFDDVGVLLRCSWHAGNTMTFKVRQCLIGIKRRLTINYEFAHRAEDSDPTPINSPNDGGCYFVSDDFTDMPPDATAYQVAYNEALNEDEINLNLVIELHGYL